MIIDQCIYRVHKEKDMLEAVTSVLQTAPVARGNADQVSNARSFAANPDKIQEAPRAPYISPYIYMDVNYDKAVLQIRDSETGDVVRQFPSETRLRSQSAEAARTEDMPSPPQQTAGQDSGNRTARSEAPDVSSQQQQTARQEAPPQQSPGNAATAQQLAAFKTAATTASAGNGGQVSLFA